MIDIGIALLLLTIGYLIGREPKKKIRDTKKHWLYDDVVVERFGYGYILKEKKNEKIR